MRLMLCQTHIIWEDKEKNISRAEELFTATEAQQVDLVCFPEMSFTGFSMNTSVTADSSSLETLHHMEELAKKYHVAVAFGYVTRTEDGEKAYNHYAVVDCQGNVLGDYIKIHPFSYGKEDQYFRGGDRLVHFDYKGFHIGLAVCYDLRFPEQFQVLGDSCDLILLGANWPAKRSLHWRALSQARAIENQCYMAVVNCCGEMDGIFYQGDSMVIYPDGSIPASGICPAGEGYVICDLENDVAAVRAAFPVRQDRKRFQV